MLNNIIIQGRLVADPELRQTPSGTAVANCRIACDRDFKDRETGERKSDFVNVVAWRQTAEFLAKNFQKGRTILVTGRIQNTRYTDKNGANHQSLEIVADNIYFCDSKITNPETVTRTLNQMADPQYTPTGRPIQQSYYAPAAAPGGFTPMPEDDRNLPF